MIKNSCLIFFYALAIIFMAEYSNAQTLRNESLSSIGTSKIANGILIHQSIGQLSVIGSFKNSKITGNQGFLRGIFYGFPIDEKPFTVLTFPNSFSEKITFRFFPALTEVASFTIFDMFGKQVFNDDLKPINNEVLINLDFLSNAVYLVIIKLGNRTLQTRIIKKT